MSSIATTAPTIAGRTWLAVLVLALAAEVAWMTESMFLGLFIHDTITDDPRVIALMTAAGAIAANVAALLLGVFTDRAGRRRGTIAVGFVLWGLATMSLGLVTVERVGALAPVGSAVALAVVAVILADSLMSFLGGGGHRAAFSGWVTDVTAPANRMRVETLIVVVPFIAMLVAFIGLDPFTHGDGWTSLFTIVGVGLVLAGIAAWFLVRDAPGVRPQRAGVARAMAHFFRPSTAREHPQLYLALGVFAALSVATAVFMPYLFIYARRTLRLEGYLIVLGIALVLGAIICVFAARLAERVGKTALLIPATTVYVAGLVLMFIARDAVFVTVAGTLTLAGFLVLGASAAGLVRDHSPADRAGAVQGARLVLTGVPASVIGPFIGAAVIAGANETYEHLGEFKQVPSAGIFLAAALVLLLAYLPALALRHFHNAGRYTDDLPR